MNVRRASGIIDYSSALATVALPTSLTSWPQPIEWSLVLRDDESRGRLEVAAQTFRKLLAESDLEAEEQRVLETWYVASLANNPDRQDLAEEELSRLLSANPDNYRLLAWALSRFPHRDFPAAVEAARSAVIDKSDNLEKLITLAYYYVSKRKLKKATNLLRKAKPLFERQGAAGVWTMWMTQVTALMDGADCAMQILDSMALGDSETRRFRANILRLTGDAERTLATHLEESYRVTGDARFLLDFVGLNAARKNWSAAAEFCELVVAEIKTAEVLWLASDVAFQAQRPSLCLQLLTQGASLFPNSRLPSELRRIRIDSQRQLGLIPLAIEDAVQLANEEPSLDNLVGLSQLYFSIGDHRSLCSVAQKLLRLDLGAPSSVYLQLAWQCQWEDTNLSILLWSRAMEGGFQDKEVVTALLLGHNLGLEDRLKDLTRRMTELGAKGQGGVQLASLDDIKNYAQAFHRSAQKAISNYEQGEVPVHVIAHPMHLTIAQIMHQHTEEVRESRFAWRAPCILARSGRKPIPNVGQSISACVLNADVTSLLLAHHFGYLDRIEEAFAPIRIPPDLIPSLTAMQHQLTASQPARLQGFRMILQAISEGHMTTAVEEPLSERNDLPSELDSRWAALCCQAKAAGGYVVDFLPIVTASRMIPVADLPEDLRPVVIGLKSVLRSLVRHGPLTNEDYGSLLDRLASIQSEPDEVVPPPNSVLYFRGTSIEPSLLWECWI
jgi:hypothetical protein